jgi:hypothetical protein
MSVFLRPANAFKEWSVVKLVHLIAAAPLIAAGASAVAQPSVRPGTTVPTSKGPCAAGYDEAIKDGLVQKLTADEMKEVDKDGDGRISKPEFDNACANQVIKDQGKKG